jgi:hypothetical protein
MGIGVAVRRGRTFIAIAATVVGMVSTGTEPASAAYQYTPIANSTGNFGTNSFADYALGNNGHVVFANLRDDGQNSINRWNGSSLETIAVTGPAIPGWSSALHSPTVNAAGQVAFFGVRVASQTEGFVGAYRAESGGTVTNVAEVSASQTATGYLIGTDINASGTVAYQRRVVGTSRGIFTRNGPAGAEQTIYVGTDADNLGWWSINSSGHVAISGTIGGVMGVWKGTGNGALTPIATGNFTGVRTPVIDDAGNVTFGATLTNGTTGIYRGNGSGGLTTIADSTATFSGNFARTSANNDGDVAFLGTPIGGSTGIYFLPTGANAADAQEVIGIGDALFGGIVEALILTPRGLNDADQVAFMYRLALEPGQTVATWGVAVAAVPEPGSCLAVSLLALVALHRRRR